jgi:threonine dehydrogenase-like Zn-dependent dehydrogenase
MTAVWLASGEVSLLSAPLPTRLPGFSLVRVQLAGICNTDLELKRGYYGFAGTPGHEFVGSVVETDTPALLGRRVTGEINLACGRCSFCDENLPRHCLRRQVLGIVRHPGAFAEYLTLPDANLHIVPDSVSDEQAVFVEPLAAASEIFDQVNIPAGERVAVLGDGKLGLLIAQVLEARGVRAVVYGRHLEKLRIAQRAGAEIHFAPQRPAAEYQFVIEATGSAQGLTDAIAMARPRGTVVMKSTVHGTLSLDTAPVIVNELTLVGSRCGRFEPALTLLEENRVDVMSMLAARFPLSDAPAAFAAAARPGVLKVLLEMPS